MVEWKDFSYRSGHSSFSCVLCTYIPFSDFSIYRTVDEYEYKKRNPENVNIRRTECRNTQPQDNIHKGLRFKVSDDV